MLKRTLTAVAAITLLTACENNPTAPTQFDPQASVEIALMGGGAAFQDGGPQPAILQRLVHAAIMKIKQDQGDEAARAASDGLKTLAAAVRTAHQAHDSAAVRTAMNALRQAEATLVASTLPEAVAKTVTAADEALTRFKAALAKAAADGHDATRGNALAASLQAKLDAAKAGSGATALLNATDVLNALHLMRDRHQRAPGDSTRRRP
jgi:hypothetical protein